MSLTTKSPRKVVLAALAVGKDALADYSHPCSPKVFTQPQLFACLVLKQFLGTDFRGVEEHLRDLPAYREWLGLKKVPDHSTLHKAAQRFFPVARSDQLLAASIRLMMGRRKVVRRAALDSTGLESRHVSAYFVKRRQRGQTQATNPLYQTTTYTRFPKLAILLDCDTHQALSMLARRGPSPDTNLFGPLLDRVPRGVVIHTLLAMPASTARRTINTPANSTACAASSPPRSAVPPANHRRASTDV